jgi:hypothetical protein
MIRLLCFPGAFLLSWFYWAVGQVGYLLLCLNPYSRIWCALWYPCYNDNMMDSLKIQEWAHGKSRLWPWSTIDE